MEKLKDLFTHENLQAAISYLTSGGLMGFVFTHFNDVVQGIGGIIGLAIGVQRFLYDRSRFKRSAANDR